MDQRESGILLPVSALPGPYGVGTLGAPALNFIDFLARAGQSNWQILPLVPPGGGNSPYMSPSSFAGNPLLLDLEELAAEGLLTREELEGAQYPNPDRVDYPWLYGTRFPLLRRAWERGKARYAGALADFLKAEESWLPDFVLFLALRDRLGGAEGLAGGAPAAPAGGPGGRSGAAGGGDRLLRLSPADLLPPVEKDQGLRQPKGRLHHRRSAHLCLPGQRGGVGPAAALPAGRKSGPRRGGRRPARRLFRRRPALGQPPL